MASGLSADAPAGLAADHDLMILTPHLSVVEALHAMAAQNLGSAVVRPTTRRPAHAPRHGLAPPATHLRHDGVGPSRPPLGPRPARAYPASLIQSP
jgi:hypothetical protein